MTADLVSSAAYEIQLTADCELLHSCAARGRKTGERSRGKPCFPRGPLLGAVRPGLEEAADGLAGYAEADDFARAVDVGDRVGGDQAAMAREEACADRECVGHVRQRPVHRTLDLAD